MLVTSEAQAVMIQTPQKNQKKADKTNWTWVEVALINICFTLLCQIPKNKFTTLNSVNWQLHPAL